MVPYSYSERANELYHNSKLNLIDGAGHGFKYKDLEIALENINDFLIKL